MTSPAPANNYETVGLFLLQNGYSAFGAAGVCGCIAGESGGDPEAVQFPSDPESGGAGLIQWTPASSMGQYGGTCASAGIGNNSVTVDMQNQMNAILAIGLAAGALVTVTAVRRHRRRTARRPAAIAGQPPGNPP